MSGPLLPGGQAPRDAIEPRCPRCGGAARARQRRPASMNPFLSKKEPTEITCDDCGLDFEPQGAEPAQASKRAPWFR